MSRALPVFSGVRLLLAEDNEVNQEVARELLQQAGIQVDIANNGQEALDLLSRQTYAIVLLDVQMPVMDGLEVASRIRADSRYAQLPIIAMTASVLPEDRAECLRVGMNDFIAKPIDVEAMFACLKRWLPGKGTMVTASSAGRETAAADDDPLAAIAGLDVASGLARVGNERSVYLRLLRKFRENHAEALEQIANEWQRGDSQSAQGLLHALKGVSGNVSARDLYASICQLESAISQGKDDAVIAALELARQRMNILLAGVDGLLAASHEQERGTSAPVARKADFNTCFNLLKSRVDACETDAQDALQAAWEASDVPADPVWLELKSVLGRYDFEAANVCISRLAEKLDALHEGGDRL